MNSYFWLQMVQQSCQEEATNSENPLQDGNKPKGAKFSVKNFKANRESLNRQNQKMTLKPVPTFWSIQGDFIYRHHNEPRVQLYVPKEETCLIPLTYSARLAYSDLDARETCRWLLECRFEQKLVIFVESLHKIHSIERKTFQRIYVVW